VWLNFKPQTGREQDGRRPAIVLSNSSYNEIVGLAIFCPVTSKVKGYPFEVGLPNQLTVSGVILADQIKSLDWKQRNAEFITKLDEQTLEKVLTLLGKIIEL
ncbi:MAG: type II toxin-antitoxin system PemK/MazF family toxin, partial [Prolixibacteraceae bacterium]|nr:type II toxin-antitoxin system PemK/MazF family toxin [Prolixibacteraceae bacterium]